MIKIINIEGWGLNLTTEKPLLIAGPCSAETEFQTIQSCIGAKKNGAQILRAGIWKPRTRPNSFEGVGSVGLKWLKTAGQLTGLPVTVEVAHARHVEEALKNQIDILWIGARTTVNPFSVQEIADALQGVDVPVMVKNPVNPDLKLWIGAFERFEKAGIQKMAAIHRGFSSFNTTEYRNKPEWEIPIELRRLIPNLEIINDPSHICGRRDILQKVAQKAMDLDFDGLMIETHITPDAAWSDAEQQVTPEGLGQLMAGLVVRHSISTDPLFNSKMEALRSRIDELDTEILELLSRRMCIAREIGQYKKENGITILQISRWEKILRERSIFGLSKGLSSKFTDAFLQEIHKESIRQQTAVMNETTVEKV